MTVCGSWRLSRISANARLLSSNSAERNGRVCAILLIMISPTACAWFLVSTVLKLLLESVRHGLALFLSEMAAERNRAPMGAHREHGMSARSGLQDHLRPMAVELVAAQLAPVPLLHQHLIPFDRQTLEIRRMPLHVAKREKQHAHFHSRKREHQPGAEKSK